MPSTIPEQKAALRRRITALPRPDWDGMLAQFTALPELEEAGTVMLFYGVGREPETSGLIETLLKKGKTVVLPRILPARRMEARAVDRLDSLIPNRLSIPEPGEDCPVVPRDQVDLILAPNLCCDREGFRLGWGGGYYDRYLAGFGGTIVALCPSNLLQERLPREETDLPVHLILTEAAKLPLRRQG